MTQDDLHLAQEADHQNQRGTGASETTPGGSRSESIPGGNAPESRTPSFDEWALVEIMGHQQIVGRLREQVIAGKAFLRVDVPGQNGDKDFTRFYGPDSIYCISPVSEDVAKAMLQQSRFRNEPIKPYDIPRLAEKFTPDSGEDNRYGGDET